MGDFLGKSHKVGFLIPNLGNHLGLGLKNPTCEFVIFSRDTEDSGGGLVSDGIYGTLLRAPKWPMGPPEWPPRKPRIMLQNAAKNASFHHNWREAHRTQRRGPAAGKLNRL